ncbi:hypothetical protein L195_g047673 [Trifolium pratense]|uniref:RNase H type-1 domain-containing protein n=1 Tax=Trifolium pratense TaxID=57577 RepID=A0A2K3ML81_TRIPR|nr:hypothetical protein L195_g047673 [Trifolium pratense]
MSGSGMVDSSFDGWVMLNTDGATELWGILESLRLARAGGLSNIEFCVDLEAVILCITNTGGGTMFSCRLVKKIRQMLQLNWEIKMRHVNRKDNFWADGLATLRIDAKEEFTVFDVCHEQIMQFYNVAIAGVSTARLVVLGT